MGPTRSKGRAERNPTLDYSHVADSFCREESPPVMPRATSAATMKDQLHWQLQRFSGYHHPLILDIHICIQCSASKMYICNGYS